MLLSSNLNYANFIHFDEIRDQIHFRIPEMFSNIHSLFRISDVLHATILIRPDEKLFMTINWEQTTSINLVINYFGHFYDNLFRIFRLLLIKGETENIMNYSHPK